MRVAIFTNNYLPNPYGVSRSIETFRYEFEKQGHSVFIFAPKFKGYQDENPHVFRYPALDINIKFRFPLAIPYSQTMDKIIEKLDLDIIHAQHPNLLGTVARKWSKRKKIPLIFTWHTLYDKYTNFVPFIPARISAGYIIKKAVNFANEADVVITPTNSIIPILKKWGVRNKNIAPIATGVFKKEFDNSDGDKIRRKYQLKKDDLVLFTVSRLTSEKNVEFILQSVKDILKRDHIKLMIVGGGYLTPKLKYFCEQAKIKNKVIFCGEIGKEEMKNYYAAGDIFVYGSKSETQGMIVTEAMYLGLPIVAVSATGINNLVLNDGNGFLTRENKQEFAQAVEKLIADKNLRQKFGKTSQKIIQDQFTSEICAQKMLAIYEKAIKAKKQF